MSKPSFLKAFARTVAWEGGFQNDPDDRGNYCGGKLIGTSHGISAAAWKGELGRCPTEGEMRALGKSDAERFFLKNYWNVLKGDQLPSQELADILVDWGWISGPGTAVKGLQKALNAMGEKLVVDGGIGPKTLTALYRHDPADVTAQVFYLRRADIDRIVTEDPTQQKFYKGWMNRLESFFPKGSA
ncbi:Predicted Peptidoglycan domain-containing protein [Catalinimonas alkaloidigena]|uniref:Predicted Peptidoglycan domain-containing protein n=1 Tax=Catalinimonas alkaloidigena TaxID=1075417 RepID=A0A1G9V9W1_9BACT|nr:glycosyl hydrolase 108 family protein [Catalinimonas alkaloidigena]SDM68959.1 Predicted Peptidoglycan domain-containing protein [Catalinimonas alkaloidigena]